MAWKKLRKSVIVNGKLGKSVVPLDELYTHKFSDGDKLSFTADLKTLSTPDGCINLRDREGRTFRLPRIWRESAFENYILPEHLVLLTGAGTETLKSIGEAHISNYEKFIGLENNMSILEIGSGIGRDVFQLLKKYPAINFVGIDVTRDSVQWCKDNITKQYSNFIFYHFDAYHELYNPLGEKNTNEFEVPVPDNSVDRVFLGSVFTHLFEPEIRHYLKEICRILKPKGMVYATFFLYSEEIIKSARKSRRSHNGLTFEYEHSTGCYVSDPNFPTGSVAYTDELMTSMISDSGLELSRDYLKGWWSGHFDTWEDGQEVAILQKSSS